MAATHVQSCADRAVTARAAHTAPLSSQLAGLSRVWREFIRRPRYEFKSMEGIQMKSMLFILVAQLHSGGTQTVAAYPNLEQCRDALKTAASNVAADYTCAATPLQGRWSQKDSRFLMARE
jgi:hypothetical protein